MALVRCHLQRAFCGFSKRFIDKSSVPTTEFCNFHHGSPSSMNILSRHYSYSSSVRIDRFQPTVKDFEIVENPSEWKYVERLLPISTVPKPPAKGEFDSGWQPQNPELYQKLPYFVKRTKNHMLPVHLKRSWRNQRKITKIRYILGDIWALAEDINEYLKEKHKRVFAVQVNEYSGFITIRGDFVIDSQNYLLSVGL